MLKYFLGHPRWLRGHYNVTFGFTQNALIELKFDMNDCYVNLSMELLKVNKGHYDLAYGLIKMLQLSWNLLWRILK